ncbi:MAG: TonB-dependent receptor [Nitrospirota bacterium]
MSITTLAKGWLAFGLFTWLPVIALAQKHAEFSLVLLRDGAPVSNVTVSLEGEVIGTTDRVGRVELALPPGQHDLLLRDGDQTLAPLAVTVGAGASVQVIVTLFNDGRPPLVDLESSGEATAGQAEVQAVLQTGTVSGRVVSTETGAPVSGARVFASGTDRQTQTNADGGFTLGLPVGVYALSVIHPQFSTQTLNDVHVAADQAATFDVELTPSGVELQEFVVTAPYIEGSVAAVAEQQRESFSVTEVLGADQMEAAGDSDAADALQRVTGLTVEGGKFVHVRGLPERYTKTLWNGSELPSPDPNRRVVPLDLFPTDSLKSVEVQKTYSPDLPGSFGGGLMQLETRGVPDERFLNVSLSTGYNSEATFKDGLTYRGGGLDWLGIDDGTRALPSSVEAAVSGNRELAPISISNPNGFTDEELEALGEAFPNIYRVDEYTVMPDAGLSVAGGNRFYLGRSRLGFLGSLAWNREWEQRIGPENTYGLSGTTLVPVDQYNVTRSLMEVTLSGTLTLAAQLGEHHSLTSNTFLIRKTTDMARLQTGLRGENDDTVRESTLEWVERQLLTQQLVGSHAFPMFHDLLVDWRAMFSQGKRYSPDRRFYRYIEQSGQFVFEESSLARRYDELNDDILNLALDLSLPLGTEDRLFALLKAGAARSSADRKSEIQTFQFLWEQGSIPLDIATEPNPEDIFNAENIRSDGFVLDDLTGANDDYEGTEDVDAVYLMADTRVYNTVRVTGGVRSEQASLNVRTFQAAGSSQNEVKSVLETSDVLPAATATWFLTPTMQLRLGYGATVSRPDLKELSPASYNDPETGDTYVGQPNLEETTISGLDLRWEWYPSGTESLTFGTFWKDFTNPIETVKIPGFNAPRSFQNADEAINMGIELGYRMGLGSLGRSWEAFFVAGNAAWIDSEVTLADTLFTNTNKTRPLQGQAPYVFNLALGFDGVSTDATILFNVVGERISEVGIQGQPDVMEQPAPELDVVFSQRLTRSFKYKLSAKNLLNPEVKFLQDDQILRSYRKGFEIAFSIGWDL